MEAAMKVKSWQWITTSVRRNTGAGAALSIAIAVIGYNKSCTIAKRGIKAKDEHIAKMIAEGKSGVWPFRFSTSNTRFLMPINHLK
ncbi:DUF2620 family protein [Shigella flexneri]